MRSQPIYDPQKTYDMNFEKGPFGAFADNEVFHTSGEPKAQFLGQPVFVPFGIPAGPLLNGKYIKAALAKGFDVATYKTVRTRIYPAHPWPNVLPVRMDGRFTPQDDTTLITGDKFGEPLSITNSFGVPSFNPDFWQKDMAAAVSSAGTGQVVVGSFQGTAGGRGGVKEYIADFALAARLVKETKVKVLEINLSCPNEGTGELLCFDLSRSREVLAAVRKEIGNTPLIIKIAYFGDPAVLRKFIATVGGMADGIAAINSLPAKVVNQKGQPALPGPGRQKSGVCGAAIKWAGLLMTKRLKDLRQELACQYEIIGIGGAFTAEDHAEYRAAGADAVMSATGAMWNPYLALEIKRTLNISCAKL